MTQFVFSWLRLLRIRQWTKNGFVLAGVIFSGFFRYPGKITEALSAFAIFCLLSSAIYIWNDIKDVEEDKKHPRKRNRPIASGAISAPAAFIFSLVLLAMAVLLSRGLCVRFQICVLIFVILNIAYDLFLKHAFLIDMIAISIGYVLRALAGILVLETAPMSEWMILCTWSIALFLIAAKRLAEIEVVGETHRHTRRVLCHYTPDFLKALLLVSMVQTLVCYSIFVIGDPYKRNLILTLPFVFYGLGRYYYLSLHEGGKLETPELIIIKDAPLAACIILWGFVSFLLIVSSGIIVTS